MTIFLELSNALKELGDGGGYVGQLNDVALGGLIQKKIMKRSEFDEGLSLPFINKSTHR